MKIIFHLFGFNSRPEVELETNNEDMTVGELKAYINNKTGIPIGSHQLKIGVFSFDEVKTCAFVKLFA
jgi:hypothetical protein